MDACLIEKEIYVNNKCYIITGEELQYLICYFNSKIFNKIIFRETNITGGKGKDFLNKVFVPVPSNFEEWKQLYELIRNNPENEQYNQIIDNQFYNYFGLNKNEISYIESL